MVWSEIFDGVSKALPPAPRRPRLIQYYSSLHYQDRVKSVFEAEWKKVEDEWKKERDTVLEQNEALEEDDEEVPIPKKPAKINIRNRVTRSLWEAESEETKAEVERRVEAHHLQAMSEFEALKKLPKERSAEDYHL